MKLGLIAVAVAMLAGCTVTADVKDGPIAAEPLKGTVEGQEFVGKFARAPGIFEVVQKFLGVTHIAQIPAFNSKVSSQGQRGYRVVQPGRVAGSDWRLGREGAGVGRQDRDRALHP